MAGFEVVGDGQRIPRVRIIRLGAGVEIRAVSGPGYAKEVELVATGGSEGTATVHDHDADYEPAGAVDAHATTPHGGDAGPHTHTEYLTDEDLALHSGTEHGLSSHAIDGVYHSGAEVLPTPGQKNALSGTAGTPGDTNRYVTNQDARLSDPRAPTAHAHDYAEPGHSHPAPDLSAYATLADLEAHESTPHGGTSGDGIPAGVIAMWGGTVATIPTGWVLCDGQNGTPDLRERFIVGAGTTASGTTGGSANHTHATHASGGSHAHADHTGTRKGGTSNPGTIPDGVLSHDAQGGHTHDAHSTADHRPPFYALAFIQKL